MHFRVPKSPNPHTDGQTDSTAGGIPSLLSPVSHCISNGFRIPVYGHGPVSHSLPPAGNVTSVAGFMEPWSRTSSSARSGSRDLPAMGCIWPPHQHRHWDCPHLGPAELSLSPRKRVGASTESAISDSRFFNPVAGDALARGRQTAARLTDGETEARSARTWVRPWKQPPFLIATTTSPLQRSCPAAGAAWSRPDPTPDRGEGGKKTAPGSRRRRHMMSGAEPRASGLAARSRARM